ncbi:MAG TPA: arginyltransferase [Polyangiaceae bacterium]|nr:arginyltransferase [Polyangiaceae bacterium]
MAVPLLPEIPPELVVFDRPSKCPYLPDRMARLPLRLPVRRLARSELDERLSSGDRRQGVLLYRPTCPSCHACEPIRVDAQQFEPSRVHRRIERRAHKSVRIEIGATRVDSTRVALYNAHKDGRGLSDGQPPIDAEGYRDFLVESCCESFELRYFVGDELVGVAVTDRGENSLSAVYCHFDPAYERLSLGTLSILQQLALCRRWSLSWLYLGLYIADCTTMRYKSNYLPHERFIHGRWRRFQTKQDLQYEAG